jgi:hypothetical protein
MELFDELMVELGQKPLSPHLQAMGVLLENNPNRDLIMGSVQSAVSRSCAATFQAIADEVKSAPEKYAEAMLKTADMSTVERPPEAGEESDTEN